MIHGNEDSSYITTGQKDLEHLRRVNTLLFKQVRDEPHRKSLWRLSLSVPATGRDQGKQGAEEGLWGGS